MRAKLVGVVGSHPVITAELMLRFKGVEFTRFDLPNMTHRVILPLMRYRGSTVPVMAFEGRTISGTMKIARALEQFVPEPPLFPATDRVAIEAAEAWADAGLQDGVRQLARYATGKDPEAISAFIDGPLLGVPEHVVLKAVPVMRPAVMLQMRISEETARRCLEALPAQLDRVDALLADGVIGGERPNAADFQVAPSVRLMLCFDQLREHIDARPAGRHARALVPEYRGRFREVLPAQWLPF